MPSVTLDRQEWNQIISILATQVTWNIANPLLMKLQAQLENQPETKVPVGTSIEKGNSKAADH